VTWSGEAANIKLKPAEGIGGCPAYVNLIGASPSIRCLQQHEI
jgi:hypothetical protein